MKISIYGIGNFGYALLKHLDKKKSKIFSLHAFDIQKELIEHLQKTRRHLYIQKSAKISKNIIFENSVEALIKDCDILILAVISDAIREVLKQIKPFITKKLIIVNTAKALDYKTGERLSKIISQELKNKKIDIALLAGGTIAKDLFRQEPLGVDIACKNKNLLPKLKELFESNNLSVYPTTDLTGVEYAAAFKNIISILAGIIKGAGFSYGAETHIISRAAYEAEKIIVEKFKGKKDTFAMKSQCWGNDLWMSCTGNTRNKAFGILLGKGYQVKTALNKMKEKNKTVEGITTIQSLKKAVDITKYPLMNFLYNFINQKATLRDLKKIIASHNF